MFNLFSDQNEFIKNMEERFEKFKKDMEPRIEDLKFTLRKIRDNPISMIGLGIISALAVIAIFAPVLAPPSQDSDNPYLIPREGYGQRPNPPSAEHIMGETKGQYDIYYGVIWGTRTAFKIGILVVGGMLLIGTVLGSLAGYYGGTLDEIIMRLVDIILAVPAIILVIVVVTVFGKGLLMVMVALIFAYWPYYARLIRSEILSVREKEYVESARAVGASNFRIITRHILPNSYQSILVMASLDMGTMVIVAAALSFLGLGAPPGYADWGSLLSLSRPFITEPQFWYTHVFPGLFIFLYVFGWILISDAFRDITDPWLRRR